MLAFPLVQMAAPVHLLYPMEEIQKQRTEEESAPQPGGVDVSSLKEQAHL